MLRTRLLTATAAIALFGAGSAFAQDATAPSVPPAQTQAPSPAPVPNEAVTPPQAAAPVAANTVIDVLKSNGQFTTLLAALDAAQLTDTLKTQPAISIFAPTDAAFAALSEADRTRLMDPANVNELRQLLLYHVVVADVNSSQIEGTKGGVETAARTEVQLDGTGSAIKVDEATVTIADIDASNGAIFAIDRVLNPADSQVASGDANETEATTPTENTTTATPPADETMTGNDMDTDSATTDGETAAPKNDTMTAPTGSTSVNPTPQATTAPNGQPATSTATTASPPVSHPTDGQTNPAPRPQS